MGRDEKNGVTFETSKLPRLELWNKGVGRVIPFQHAWVKQPWGFMLRLNSEVMTEVLKAEKVDVLFGTSMGDKRIAIPQLVVEQWRTIDSL